MSDVMYKYKTPEVKNTREGKKKEERRRERKEGNGY